MKRSILVHYEGRKACVSWYDGTSDVMVEKAMQLKLALPSSAFLLQDGEGDVVPTSASLPFGEYTVVMFDQAEERDEGEGTTVRVRAQEASGDANEVRIARVESLAQSLEPPEKRMKRTTSTSVMKCFLEAFTVALAADDVVNFIPNHGEYAIDKLYSELVPKEYLPQDATSFYKLASSSIVVDRQRVVRYYRVGEMHYQLPAMGKGPLLRAYASPSLLARDPHLSKVQEFAVCIGVSPVETIVSRYEAFVHAFQPISRGEYMSKDKEMRH